MTHSSSFHHFSRYARHFFSGTLLSRVSGMFRDISMAAIFGDHPSVAAFMVAFRFSHFLRRLLGEGILQAVFIPHYEELRLSDERRASGFFFRLTWLVTTLLVGIVLIVEGASFSQLYNNLEDNEVLRLFAWMFPSLVFIGLYGLNISLLQCHQSFFLSSVAPFVCNLIWIIAIFLFAEQEPSIAMVNVALFTLIGFVIQWVFTVPKTWKILSQGKQSYDPPLFAFPREIRTLGKATVFGLIGVTAVQINSFLDMVFARYAELKGPLYLWYAIRLEQLPLAVVGFACVYSIVPSLSGSIKAQAWGKAQELFDFGYKRILMLVTPCNFALFAWSFASVDLLFGRGHFSPAAVVQTALCLWAYGLSLLPATLTIYQSSLFYAFGNYTIPVIASLISVLASLLLNGLFVFVFHWGAISIALSTSFSTWLNYGILRKTFARKGYGGIQSPRIATFSRLFVVSFIAFLGCLFLDRVFLGALFFQEDFSLSPRAFSTQCLYFLGQLMSFVTIFLLGLLLIHKEMFLAIKDLIFSKEAENPSQ